MPISKKQFESGKFKKRVYTRKDHPVFKFLEKNPGKAFTVAEIAKSVKMKEETIRSMLAGLIADGLIVHKIPYWAIKQRPRSKRSKK